MLNSNLNAHAGGNRKIFKTENVKVSKLFCSFKTLFLQLIWYFLKQIFKYFCKFITMLSQKRFKIVNWGQQLCTKPIWHASLQTKFAIFNIYKMYFLWLEKKSQNIKMGFKILNSGKWHVSAAHFTNIFRSDF